MRLKELIDFLQKALDEYGDSPVLFDITKYGIGRGLYSPESADIEKSDNKPDNYLIFVIDKDKHENNNR